MSNHIILEGRLTSDRAADLRDLLTEAPDIVSLDGTKVETVGALCAQEIYRAFASRSGTTASFSLRASSEMRADLELMGLSAILLDLGDNE
ncbi:hypothetical protein [Palleronia sp.]|uniref:hypothetical protein n=1 Tax=Palleronia sp. TaxID=1940284 RepID=UPI0035C7CF2E